MNRNGGGVQINEPHGPLRRGITEAGKKLGIEHGGLLCDSVMSFSNNLLAVTVDLEENYQLGHRTNSISDKDMARKMARIANQATLSKDIEQSY